MSRQEIQAVVDKGCPNILRKAVNSSKRLRAYLQLDEGDVSNNTIGDGNSLSLFILSMVRSEKKKRYSFTGMQCVCSTWIL